MRIYTGTNDKGKEWFRLLVGYDCYGKIYCDTHGEVIYENASDADPAFEVFIDDIFPKDWNCTICGEYLSGTRVSDPYGKM